jgi:hypothetical protein
VKIRFETTIDDIVAFNIFHHENSPVWQRQRLIGALVAPGLIAFLSFLWWIVDIDRSRRFHDVDGSVAFGAILLLVNVVISIPVFFFTRWRIQANLVSSAKKLLSEGSNRTILGWREMEIVNNRLCIQTELIDAKYDMRAIQKIVSNEQYTYVYIASVQAFVIPMTLYPEDEYRAFVTQLREAWENRDNPTARQDAPLIRKSEEGVMESKDNFY